MLVEQRSPRRVRASLCPEQLTIRSGLAMKQVDIHQAKTELSKLVERAEAGEEIVIARAGKPAAKLVPLTASRSHRRLGPLDGKFQIPDDFNAPLPDSVVRVFEGRSGEALARHPPTALGGGEQQVVAT